MTMASPRHTDDSKTTSLVHYSDDSSFEEIMRNATQQRRQREDAQIGELRVTVRRLEAALTAETKRRLAAVKALQDTTQQELKELEKRLVQQLRQEQEDMDERFNKLESRIAKLEDRFETDVVTIHHDVDAKAQEIEANLQELQSTADQERQNRLQREGRLLQQLDEISTIYENRWKSERQDRISSLQILKDRVDQQDSQMTHQVSSYESRLQQELALLQQELQQESTERQVQDEQIVAALNRYTQQLQKSLSIVSGV